MNSRLRKVLWSKLFISILVLFIFLIYSVKLNVDINKYFPDTIEYKNILSSSDEITFTELERVERKYTKLDICGYSMNFVNSNNHNIDLVYTNEKYCDVYKLNLIKGSHITEEDIISGNKVAVISEKLCLELYKNYDIQDRKLDINGVKYDVIGIYEENDGLLYESSDDMYSRVIVPYTTTDYTKEKVDAFAINSEDEISPGKLKSNIRSVIGDKIDCYEEVDYSEEKDVATEGIYLTLYILGLIIIIYCIYSIVNRIKKEYFLFYSSSETMYFSEILIKERKNIIISIIIILVILIFAISVYKIISFNLVLVSKYIPTENIFDFNYYKDKIIYYNNLKNSGMNGISTVYDRYYNSVLKVQAINSIMVGILAIITSTNIHELKLSKNINEKQ